MKQFPIALLTASAILASLGPAAAAPAIHEEGTIRLSNPSPAWVFGLPGSDGLFEYRLSEATPGASFTLRSTDGLTDLHTPVGIPPPAGDGSTYFDTVPDFDIFFFDEAGMSVEGHANGPGDEAGTVPAGATSAYVILYLDDDGQGASFAYHEG